ncbi:MAG: hypothetical protein KDD64_12550 [Bdellovibrionales bacterium]|nr:hypothetical protein [Bdellovibrionales bacterium]
MKSDRAIPLLLFGIVMTTLPCTGAFADHPIEVQRKTAAGEYFDALVSFERIPSKRRTVDSQIAAAKSAWALGLSSRASADFESLVRNTKLAPVDEARIQLSRGIIEYQEKRFQVAALFSEKVVRLLKDESPLRSRAWMLWGKSLVELGAHGAAQEKFQNALLGAEGTALPEVYFHLGKAQLKLGILDEAKASFEMIPLGYERTPEAIRSLAQIAHEQHESKAVLFWLEKGRTDYPDAFLDSWVDYAMLGAAADLDDVERMREIRKEAREKYPPSDIWLTLLEAAAERSEWDHQFAVKGGE